MNADTNSVITALGGMNGNKIMVELVKLLKGQFQADSGAASVILTIRESDLTETERLLLAYLYGKHIGSACILNPKCSEEALEYLLAMAELVVSPIEEVENGYAKITED